MKTYITFGQSHVHSINGKTFDKDCVAVIHCKNAKDGRNLALEIFGQKFSFEYPEKKFNFDDMKFYPRGFINAKNKKENKTIGKAPGG